MKCVVFLAFLAFITGFLPNRVEALKCYQCLDSMGPFLCKTFGEASAEEREQYIIEEIFFNKCKKCMKKTENGEVTARSCVTKDVEGEAVNDLGGGKIVYLCESDLCNGGGAESRASKGGDEESSGAKGGAGSFWMTAALLATTITLLKGSLF